MLFFRAQILTQRKQNFAFRSAKIRQKFCEGKLYDYVSLRILLEKHNLEKKKSHFNNMLIKKNLLSFCF